MGIFSKTTNESTTDAASNTNDWWYTAYTTLYTIRKIYMQSMQMLLYKFTDPFSTITTTELDLDIIVITPVRMERMSSEQYKQQYILL